jgi:hypothetical protein
MGLTTLHLLSRYMYIDDTWYCKEACAYKY